MWTGPCSIISEPNELHVRITDKNGETKPVSVDRLKIFKRRDKENLKSWSNYNDTLEMAKKNQPNLSDNDEDME